MFGLLEVCAAWVMVFEEEFDSPKRGGIYCMHCFCQQKEIWELKLEGDVGADPIWCNRCGCNFDLEDLPITSELKNEVREWASVYGEWIDWDKDILIPNGIEMEEKHNIQGAVLTEKIKVELRGKYKVKFSFSTLARHYTNEKF
ncbi:hypothetical protein [Rossellomorea aquimaris]|nr:hypothetical protein [Rossellomorea aquimaris]